MEFRTYVGACFDLDGTLVDTAPLHVRAEREALSYLGVGDLSSDHPDTFGMGLEPGTEALARQYGLRSAQDVMDVYLPLWEEQLRLNLALMPGARSVLATLKAAGVPTALVTSGEKSYANDVFHRLELAEYFSAVVTWEDVANPKPHPEPYLLAAERLNIAPELCVGFEDSRAGLIALKAAGMRAFLVHPDNAARARLQPYADDALETLSDFDEPRIARLFE